MSKKDVKCYLCGSSDLEKISDNIRYGAKKRVFRCNGCKIVFLFPQMTVEEEAAYYREEYRKNFSYGTTVEDHFNRALPEAVVRRGRISHLLSKKKKLLEIGCACGYFLSVVKSLVGEADGVEPHIEYGKYAAKMGFKIFKNHTQCPKNSYDVICMFMTLEHMRDPVRTLSELRSLLKPKGVLIVEVPNVDDILISVFKVEAFKNYYWQAPHYFYFSPKTLSMVLSQAGYAAELIPVQRYDLSNNITWLLEGKPGGQGKYNHIFDGELNERYTACLCKKMVSDTLIAISRKSGNELSK